jgi:PRTRC genetic system ThiF family protein
MPKKAFGKQQLDTSFAKAARLLLPSTEKWNFVLVGCGGTGSWLAPSIARLAYVLGEAGKTAQITFYDHDTVEPKNIPRQNFCHAELGVNKAKALACRYSAAWGVGITVYARMFSDDQFRHPWDTTTIIIGCVDNAAARQELAKTLRVNRPDSPHRMWWLDCGNSESSGQILFGSCLEKIQLRKDSPSQKICTALPGPSMLAPDLLEPRPEELAKSALSCAELQMANIQSLAVNQQVAAIATDYLVRITLGGELKKQATWFDLISGSSRSQYINPAVKEAVESR